jgi:hypothetical protein
VKGLALESEKRMLRNPGLNARIFLVRLHSKYWDIENAHLFIYLKCVTSSFPCLLGIWIKENMASSASIVLSYHPASKVTASLDSNVWVYPNSIHPSPANM